MTSLTRTLLLAFAAAGLAASTASNYVHYRLLTQPNYASFCDINAAVSCTAAYLSPYGSLWGVPVALLGVAFFGLVLMLALSSGRLHADTAPPSHATYIFALSTVGLSFVFYLAWASYIQLKLFCVLCAVTYVSIIALFVISARAASLPVTMIPRRALQDMGTLIRKPVALFIAALFVGAVGLAFALFPRETAASPAAQVVPLTDQQRTDIEKWWKVQPETPVPIAKDGAKVLVVKFSDYMCPACRQTYEDYKGVLGKYLSGGQVRYIVKHFPLEAECNPSVRSNHLASCEAAAAVIMARPKGTAEKLEEWIFTHQTGLTPAAVKGAAKDVGGISDFDAQYAATVQQVTTDAKLGTQLAINSTPTFYINGRKLEQAVPPAYFDYLIEVALKDAK